MIGNHPSRFEINYSNNSQNPYSAEYHNYLGSPQVNLNPYAPQVVQAPDVNLSNVIRAPNPDCCSSLGCSIFNTVCCFFWLGIPAIVFSVIAKTQYSQGQFIDATKNSQIAKIFNIFGIITGSLFLIIAIIFVIVYTTNVSSQKYPYYSYNELPSYAL